MLINFQDDVSKCKSLMTGASSRQAAHSAPKQDLGEELQSRSRCILLYNLLCHESFSYLLSSRVIQANRELVTLPAEHLLQLKPSWHKGFNSQRHLQTTPGLCHISCQSNILVLTQHDPVRRCCIIHHLLDTKRERHHWGLHPKSHERHILEAPLCVNSTECQERRDLALPLKNTGF